MWKRIDAYAELGIKSSILSSAVNVRAALVQFSAVDADQTARVRCYLLRITAMFVRPCVNSRSERSNLVWWEHHGAK